jgi:hypothetical protein
VIVFFILPIVLFIYVEVHKKSSSSNSHSEHHKERYHQYDKSKVFPHLLQGDDSGNKESSNVTMLNIAAGEELKIIPEENVGDEIGSEKVVVSTTAQNTVHQVVQIDNETSIGASEYALDTMSVNTVTAITNNNTSQSEQFNNSNPIEIIHSVRKLRGLH